MVTLIEQVKLRLEKKRKNAEEAYVRMNTVKATLNCVHHGRALAEKTHVCKLGCMGETETLAGQCWDEKARQCPLMQLRKDESALRAEFRSMSWEEIRLRWPSIGELLWILRENERLIQLELSETKGRDVKAG